MRKYIPRLEQLSIATQLLRWVLFILPVAVTIGAAVALFLWLLDLATQTRETHLWLILLLPAAGVLIRLVYQTYGKSADAGNNLILEEIHQPGGGIPFRMTPLILLSTVVTHLFGGSAGREGTALQMGGSISSLFSKWYGIKHEEKRILLMCGMSAGFGAVFGTPLAGAVFALEVLAIGRIRYDALIPCFMAGMIGHITCISLGIQHTTYTIHSSSIPSFLPYISFDLVLLLKVMAAGIVFGLAGYLFSQLSHFIQQQSSKYIPYPLLVPVAGALLVIGISYLLGTFDYLGLGVTAAQENGVSIVAAFHEGGATHFSWFWKLLLTAITISTGFKGGEVTPLFFIGATLGNSIAMLSGTPVDLFAGLGFIAVFAAATNTPLACTLMGIELFGGEYAVYFAAACFMAYYFSGHSGIYSSQKIGVHKLHGDIRPD